MGKLHRLRKTIEYDPQKWIRKEIVSCGSYAVWSAVYENGKWRPAANYDEHFKWLHYRFIQSILARLGVLCAGADSFRSRTFVEKKPRSKWANILVQLRDLATTLFSKNCKCCMNVGCRCCRKKKRSPASSGG